MIHINQDLMLEVDGPMLKYGIQAMDRRSLAVPARHVDRPDRDKLSIRFEEFASGSRR